MRPDSTERSPTYGASTLVLRRLNCTTGTPDSMMSFSPLAIDSPGTDVASPSTPAATSVSAAVSWASASPPAGPVTSMLTPRSSAANCAASMICWMNGFPTTWVTNPIFRSSAGAPESGAEAPAAAERDGAGGEHRCGDPDRLSGAERSASVGGGHGCPPGSVVGLRSRQRRRQIESWVRSPRRRCWRTSWSTPTATTMTNPVTNVLQTASMPRKITPLPITAMINTPISAP